MILVEQDYTQVDTAMLESFCCGMSLKPIVNHVNDLLLLKLTTLARVASIFQIIFCYQRFCLKLQFHLHTVSYMALMATQVTILLW